jgi:hypothetical protein
MSSTVFVRVAIGTYVSGEDQVGTTVTVPIYEPLDVVFCENHPDEEVEGAVMNALHSAWYKFKTQRGEMPEWKNGDWIQFRANPARPWEWTSYQRAPHNGSVAFLRYDDDGLKVVDVLPESCLATDWLRGNIKPIIRSGRVVEANR